MKGKQEVGCNDNGVVGRPVARWSHRTANHNVEN